MNLQGGLELSLVHVLQACVQVSGEICTGPLENVLYLQSNQNNVTECLALSMGVCSQKSFHCVGAGLFSRLTILLVLEPVSAACGHVHSVLEALHEVFCTGDACTCTESTCFAVVAVIAGAEGVVVLKEFPSLVLWAPYWNRIGTVQLVHLFCISFRIWNTFDVPFDVPLTVPFPVLT